MCGQQAVNNVILVLIVVSKDENMVTREIFAVDVSDKTPLKMR